MIMLLGTSEAQDLTLIFFGLALLFGLLFFILWFPGWRRRKLEEKREAEYLQAYLENVGMEGSDAADMTAEGPADAESGESYHKSP